LDQRSAAGPAAANSGLADLAIVDAHQHFWDPAANYHPWLRDEPPLGIAALVASIAVYAAVGALIHLRNLPSIVVTLGMSFVWLGRIFRF